MKRLKNIFPRTRTCSTLIASIFLLGTVAGQEAKLPDRLENFNRESERIIALSTSVETEADLKELQGLIAKFLNRPDQLVDVPKPTEYDQRELFSKFVLQKRFEKYPPKFGKSAEAPEPAPETKMTARASAIMEKSSAQVKPMIERYWKLVMPREEIILPGLAKQYRRFKTFYRVGVGLHDNGGKQEVFVIVRLDQREGDNPYLYFQYFGAPKVKTIRFEEIVTYDETTATLSFRHGDIESAFTLPELPPGFEEKAVETDQWLKARSRQLAASKIYIGTYADSIDVPVKVGIPSATDLASSTAFIKKLIINERVDADDVVIVQPEENALTRTNHGMRVVAMPPAMWDRQGKVPFAFSDNLKIKQLGDGFDVDLETPLGPWVAVAYLRGSSAVLDSRLPEFKKLFLGDLTKMQNEDLKKIDVLSP